MTKFSIWRCWSTMLLPAVVLAGCGAAATEPVRQPVRVLTRGDATGRGEFFARVGATLPDVAFTVGGAAGSRVIVTALQRGEAELAYAQADVVYSAFRAGFDDDPRSYANLRAIGVMSNNKVFVVVRRDSPYLKIHDLKNARIGVVPLGSYGEVYARMVLEAHGIGASDARLAHSSGDTMATGLEDGTLDAAIFVVSDITPRLRRLHETVGIRVLGIDQKTTNTLRARSPFFKPAMFASEGIPGAVADLRTVGVDSLLVCRLDLNEDLVYRLTKSIFTELERSLTPGVPGIDFEEAPATPIPLHPGAARYYREREVMR